MVHLGTWRPSTVHLGKIWHKYGYSRIMEHDFETSRKIKTKYGTHMGKYSKYGSPRVK